MNLGAGIDDAYLPHIEITTLRLAELAIGWGFASIGQLKRSHSLVCQPVSVHQYEYLLIVVRRSAQSFIFCRGSPLGPAWE